MSLAYRIYTEGIVEFIEQMDERHWPSDTALVEEAMRAACKAFFDRHMPEWSLVDSTDASVADSTT